MDGVEVEAPRLLADLSLHRAIAVMLLLGSLQLGMHPWGAGYHARDPRRHDVVSLGFALSHAAPGDVAHLFDRLPGFFAAEPTKRRYMLSTHAWMADCPNGDLAELGLDLTRVCREDDEELRPDLQRGGHDVAPDEGGDT